MTSLSTAASHHSSPGRAARKKIAFIKRGHFSGSNAATRRALERQFPEYDLEEIDVGLRLLKPRPWLILLNWLCVWIIYGKAILTQHRPVGACSYYTPFIARQIRRLLLAHLRPRAGEFAFTFATQSLYDAHLPGVPHFLYTDHTHLANLDAPGFNRAFLATEKWIALERETYRHADRIFVMGENARASLVGQYGIAAERISCVHAGGHADATPLPLENDGYKNGTILFLGLDWERKGGPELVRAFAQVAARLPNARLRIAGAQPKLSHPRIEVIGRVPLERVPRLIAQASALCLPSRYEPYGIVVLEAFAQRIPVVVTRVGALAHLVRDHETGRVVEPNDPAALADALSDLLSDPEKCRRYGEAGYRFVMENCTWEAVGKKLRAEIMPVVEARVQ